MRLVDSIGRTSFALVLAGAFVGHPVSVSAAPNHVREAVKGDAFNIRSILNNRCLEIPDSDIERGTRVGMWDCWGGATTQWYWDGEQIRNKLNNLCLEIVDSDADNGAAVGMWDCWGGPGTHWYYSGENIKSRLNDRCLEIVDSKADNGAPVGMWDCWGGAATRWYMTPA